MKNIHILPTDRPSRVYLIKLNNKLGITSNNPEFTENFGSGTQNQNIYITSDEKLPYDSTIFHTGAFYHRDFGGDVHIINKDTHYPNPNFCSRIILTTDESLFKYGVQPIDDEFLEWFVKNPSCVTVDVQKTNTLIDLYADKEENIWKVRYHIYIPKEEPKTAWVGVLHDKLNEYHPAEYELKDIYQGEGCLPNFPNEELCQIWCDSKYKEEPKQDAFNYSLNAFKVPKEYFGKEEPKQETLEEAAEKTYKKLYEGEPLTQDVPIDAFKQGAKWQQERMYSEEDMRGMYNKSCGLIGLDLLDNQTENNSRFKELLEQFKKK